MKYEAFLVTIISASLILAYKSFIAISPYKLIHYLYVGLLLVSITTIILFFATGMYTDQIAYAYKFIPQTNRALRPFNMFLITPATLRETSGNRRKPIVGTMINKLFAAPAGSASTALSPHQGPHHPMLRPISHSKPSSSLPAISHPSSSQPETPSDEPRPARGRIRPEAELLTPPSGPHPEAHPQNPDEIVHHINPRGQLIFSSLVDPNFSDSYQVYRSQWELRQKKF